jgi:hypothetical protein
MYRLVWTSRPDGASAIMMPTGTASMMELSRASTIFCSWMSVQVPYQRVIRPASSRTGRARPSTHLYWPDLCRSRYSMWYGSPVRRDRLQTSQALGWSSGWNTSFQASPSVEPCGTPVYSYQRRLK